MPWTAGQVLTAAQLNQYLPQTYTSYTPTWGVVSGTAPSIGNGSLTGSYAQFGKLVVGHIRLVAGSTTTYGSGTYTLSLPVAAVSTGLGTIGTASLVDVGVTGYFRFAALFTTTTCTIGDQAAASWSNSAPFTFGNTDTATVTFSYQAA